MTPEQQAAFIMSQAACAMARIAGMQTTNQIFYANNHTGLFHSASEFEDVVNNFVIGHNAVIAFFQGDR